MYYRVPQELSYCECGGRPIFLDFRSGRYATLPGGLSMSFLALMAGDVEITDDHLERLKVLRLVEECPTRPDARRVLPSLDSEVEPARRGKAWRLSAIISQSAAKYRVRHVPFGRLIAREAALRPTGLARVDDEDLGRLRAAFDSISTWFGEEEQCLPRALAFRRIAMRLGYRPQLVIGVKVDPFAAHCWVQSGARVDNDSIERVRLFTPIHVV